MIAYKVVRVINNKYYSAVVEGKARVYYKKTTETFPPGWLAKKGYGICCFDTLASANKFGEMYGLGGLAIVEVEGNKMKLKKRGNICSVERGYLDESYSWPDGTVMLKSVKIIKVVE